MYKDFKFPDIKVGHAGNPGMGTGCTVLLTEGKWIGGAVVRGGAPGTRELALLSPDAKMDQVNGILLTGGSAFGLAAADGVVNYLREKNIGFNTGSHRVPIVPAAVIYDLDYRDDGSPDIDMGYQACLKASAHMEEGSVGVGRGATVGKIFGMENAEKAGVGAALLEVGELKVGAVAVTNALGDIYHYQSGEIIAGASPGGGGDDYLNTMKYLRENKLKLEKSQGKNTTLGIVITNARLNKAQVNKISSMAHDGLARVINPVHTMFDGDIVFSLASNKVKGDVSQVGSLAADVLARAIVRGVIAAE